MVAVVVVVVVAGSLAGTVPEATVAVDADAAAAAADVGDRGGSTRGHSDGVMDGLTALNRRIFVINCLV